MRSLIRVAVVATVTVLGVTSILGAASRHTAESRELIFHPDSAAVAEVVNNYHKALSAGDSATALNLLAPDAIVLESGGMETRSEYRSHHLPGDIGFARAVKSVRGAVRVTLAGSTAWTVSTSTTQGELNGRAINSVGAESMVLTRSAAGWRIRSIHWSSRNRRPPAT